jgi:hypothetical protein
MDGLDGIQRFDTCTAIDGNKLGYLCSRQEGPETALYLSAFNQMYCEGTGPLVLAKACPIESPLHRASIQKILSSSRIMNDHASTIWVATCPSKTQESLTELG